MGGVVPAELGRGGQLGGVVVVEPGMAQHVTGAQPLLGVLHQQLRDQVLRLWRDVSPIILLEVELSLLNIVEKV